MKDFLSLSVNGQKFEIEIEPDTPLLYVLRNDLKFNGPKYGCGLEQCGSCMVLLDGKAKPSCLIPCSEAANYDITTLEGIGQKETPHPIQEAFVEAQAGQCGYCMNGAIVTSKALLDENPKPSEDDIKKALERVLCRCGSHPRIIKAIKSASSKLNP